MNNHLEFSQEQPADSFRKPSPGAAGRKFARYAVGLPCQFASDHYSGEGQVVDVSTGGCKVEADAHFALGEYVCVTLHCLTPDRPISIELAVVRWCSEGALGVEFIRMDPTEQERLRLLVQYIEKDDALWMPSKAVASLRRAERTGFHKNT